MNLILTKFFRDYLIARVIYLLLIFFVLPILGNLVDIGSLPNSFQTPFTLIFFLIASLPIIGVLGVYWKKVFGTFYGYLWTFLIILFIGKYESLLIFFFYPKRGNLEKFIQRSIDFENKTLNLVSFFVVLVAVDYVIGMSIIWLYQQFFGFSF